MNWEKRELNAKKGVTKFTKKKTILEVRITTFYTKSERKEIGDYCKKKGISMNEFIRLAISDYLILEKEK
jgi:hypothetical protein